jgi:PAS domain S-box-containing protein
MLNSINGWAWETDSKGVLTFCSENVYDYLGYFPKEIIGKNIFDFNLPEDAKKLKHAFNEACKNKKQIKNLDIWSVQKNGKKICLETNVFAFFDESGKIQGFRGINTDVTCEKLAQEKIKDLNNELSELKLKIIQLSNKSEKGKKRLFETFSVNKEKLDEKWVEHELDSICFFDIDANILDCNDNMYRRLGYSKDEMLSLNMADFDVLETKKDLSEKIKTAKKNGTYSFKTIHKRKDGLPILVFENLQYMSDKNTFKCIVREDYLPKKTQR